MAETPQPSVAPLSHVWGIASDTLLQFCFFLSSKSVIGQPSVLCLSKYCYFLPRSHSPYWCVFFPSLTVTLVGGTRGIIIIMFLFCFLSAIFARSPCGFLGALSNCETNYILWVLHNHQFLSVFIKHQQQEFRKFAIACERKNKIERGWQLPSGNLKIVMSKRPSWPGPEKVLNRVLVGITWGLKRTPSTGQVQAWIPVLPSTGRCV